jgi:hypothetical protein
VPKAALESAQGILQGSTKAGEKEEEEKEKEEEGCGRRRGRKIASQRP